MKKREGVVRTYQHHNNRLAALIEVSCNTDFVAMNSEFLDFVDKLLLHIAGNFPESIDVLLKQNWIFDEQITVEELVEQQNKKFGEKIKIQSFLRWTLDPINLDSENKEEEKK